MDTNTQQLPCVCSYLSLYPCRARSPLLRRIPFFIRTQSTPHCCIRLQLPSAFLLNVFPISVLNIMSCVCGDLFRPSIQDQLSVAASRVDSPFNDGDGGGNNTGFFFFRRGARGRRRLRRPPRFGLLRHAGMFEADVGIHTHTHEEKLLEGSFFIKGTFYSGNCGVRTLDRMLCW